MIGSNIGKNLAFSGDLVLEMDSGSLFPSGAKVSISDVKRGSKNRNSLQFRVLEIKFLNSKLDFTFVFLRN